MKGNDILAHDKKGACSKRHWEPLTKDVVVRITWPTFKFWGRILFLEQVKLDTSLWVGRLIRASTSLRIWRG